MSSDFINKSTKAADHTRESRMYRRPDSHQSDNIQQDQSESRQHTQGQYAGHDSESDQEDARQIAGLPLDGDDHFHLGDLVEDEASTAAPREICMICGESHLGGLHLGGEFICAACEREIVQTDVSDAKYPYFIHRMKQLWQRKNA